MEIYRDKLIEAKHILEQEGPAKFYDFLEKCGFPYATLANGVAKGDSFAGNAALDFMKATALHEGRPLSEDDVNNIRVLMANGYLNALERKMGDTNILTEEITYREAWDFHSEIFTSYGLSADAWTLNSVFQSLTEAESNDYWEMVLSSAGNPSDEKSLAMITLYKMFIKTDLMDGDVDYESENNARFINWFMRAATPESIAEFSAIFGEKIGNLKTVYYDQFFGDRVISERGNDLYMESQTRMLYDPLVLDLDGDGIETVSSDAGIKFDFDGDGLKTATGWIGSDDGILTIDKNNNGKIDDGAELFGVDYVKADGNKAIDGYDALRDLDSNADGVFNASDDKFNSVKVWRDLNQDGIAQADELRSLQDHGIVSIELSSKPVNIDANGNIISQQGTYYKNTGEKGSVEGSIQDSASINFSENPFHSEFTDKLPLGQEEALLPNISGRGVLRGLQEAATLNQNLITLVGQFNADSSPTTKTQIIGQILSEWAATGVFTDLNQRLLESGAKAAGFNLDPAFIASDYVQKMMILEKFNGSEFIKFEFSQVEPYDTLAVVLGNNRHWITKSNEQNVEIGTGNIVLSPAEKFIIDRMYNALVSDIYSGVSAYGQLKSIIDLVGIDMSTLETGVKYTFDDVVDALKVSFEQDAIGATRDLIDIINIFGAKDHQLISLFAQFTDGFEASDFAALGALPPEFIAGNPLVRTEVLKYNILLPGDRVNITGNNGADFIISNHENNTMSGYAGSDTYIITANSGHDVIHEYTDSTGASENTVVFAGINTTEINEVLKINGDLIIKYQNNSSLTISRFFLDGEGTIGKFVFDDQVLSIADLKQIITIRGTDSNDVVTGFSGAVNKIEALDGDDHISAGNDGSVIHAGAGNDHIAGGNGDDLIFGEAGNDTIAGNLGNDTYVFSRGDGQDVISDYNYDSSTDKIIFKDVLSTEIVSLVKHNQDLIIDYGHGDKLTLLRYFDHEQAFNGGIEFSDGSGWARENILSKVVVLGTDNNDVLVGFNGAPNTILAGAGDDSILGSQDGNTIYGGAGNDSIAGGIGDDLIFGESGNDTINGYTGSDTYVFSRGDGQDTVKDVNDDYISSDKIIFNDVLPTEVVSVVKNKQDLIIDYGHGDTLTLSRFFDYEQSFKGGIQFSDGSIWTREHILSKTVVLGTDENDVLFGFNGAPNTILAGAGDDYITGGQDGNTIHAGAGNDTILGGDRDDLIFGESGNDTIEGNMGNDTYVFSRGDGQDTIKDLNYDLDVDKIKFKDVLSTEVVSVVKRNQDLIIDYGHGDTLTLLKFFDSANAFNGGIEFGDGAVWNREQILSKTIVLGTENNDVLFGFDGARNTILAGAGDDYITGSHAGNTIHAGAGNDSVIGGEGDDRILGESGNDSMEGNAGNDTYVFSHGDGQDTIKDFGYDNSNRDKIVFTDVVQTEIVSVTKRNNDLMIDYGQGDTIELTNFFNYAYTFNGGIEFGDGSVWTREQLLSKTVVVGTEGNDVLYGFNGAPNTILAGAGDDYITGGQDGNTIFGGDGNDQIFGGEKSDTLYGQKGNDTIDGFTGNDTYVFSRGDGQDIIKESGNDNSNLDKIKFTDVLQTEVVSVIKRNQDLVIDYGQGDTLRLSGFFNYANSFNGGIEFSDGSVWTREQILSKTITLGTDGDDTLYGFAGAPNTIIGGGGNDTIYGSELSDVLSGGKGDDVIDGSSGNDTYAFSRGDGKDTIKEYFYDNTAADKIKFSDVLSTEIVSVIKRNNDLLIDYGQGDTIKVAGFFNYANALNGGIEFSDGSVWTREQILNKTIVLGTDGDDTVYGYNSSQNTIFAGSGNDTIFGGELSDTIHGGKGNDIMEGYSGSDTYVFSRGDGQDTIKELGYDNTIADKVKFTDVLPAEIVSVLKSNYDLMIDYGHGDTLKLTGFFNYQYSFNGGIEFSDGSVWTREQILNKTIVLGTEGNDTLYGFSGAPNTILAGGGDDYIMGGQDGNTIYGGDGNDQIFGGESSDTIYGQKGNDVINGHLGNDTFIFQAGDGHDVITDINYSDMETETIKFLDVNSLNYVYRDLSNNALVVDYGDNDKLTLKNYFNYEQSFNGGIEFANGSKLSKAELTQLAFDNQLAILSQSMTAFDAQPRDAQIVNTHVEQQNVVLVSPTE